MLNGSIAEPLTWICSRISDTQAYRRNLQIVAERVMRFADRVRHPRNAFPNASVVFPAKPASFASNASI
ncbi:hypothetical protein RBWH47_01262 [Rhodopirellula baltica WH47]|uniref:Uncharacterized protein n=1 Tax=Rhodopirellula baltica WH47 TaxID=991778 RepID=F2AQN4_RHOBT|nr:hypothetical protein RBWH47_01262 [Rhodopirellula baltica WH47]